MGVFTIPDKNGREVRKYDLNGMMIADQNCCEKTKRFAKTYDQDPLAIAASADGVPVFKFKSWRLKGVARPEVLLKLKSPFPMIMRGKEWRIFINEPQGAG